jgi:transcriptional regulator with XRE-family HTH domain
VSADLPPAPAPALQRFERLGSVVREHRERAGLSLRQLAARLGVSASLLSRIENGKAQPSVTTLYGLTAELGLSLDELSTPAPAGGRGAVRPGATVVRHADDRPAVPIGAGVHWQLLEHRSEPELELLLLDYEPGATSSEDDAMLTHAGSEAGIVLSGTLVITVDGATYRLGPGDSISFDSSVPHRFVNPGDEPVRAVWLNVGRGSGAAGRVRP